MSNTHSIEFKAKPYKVWHTDTDFRMAIDLKVRVKRTDCTLRPHQHAYYNSDLFESMLNGSYRKTVGQTRTFLYLDTLPEGVTVDTSKFLAVVNIALPENFR